MGSGFGFGSTQTGSKSTYSPWYSASFSLQQAFMASTCSRRTFQRSLERDAVILEFLGCPRELCGADRGVGRELGDAYMHW